MVFPGDPSDFEDWSVWRNFHEAGRLMTTHFYVFLPTVVSHLFPGALVSVFYVQFLLGNLLPGTPCPIWLLSGLCGVFINVPSDLVAYASNKVLHAMKTSVYALDPVKCRNGESLRVLVTDLLHCGRGCYGGRRPRAVAVGIACLLVHILVVVPPVGFGPVGDAQVDGGSVHAAVGGGDVPCEPIYCSSFQFGGEVVDVRGGERHLGVNWLAFCLEIFREL